MSTMLNRAMTCASCGDPIAGCEDWAAGPDGPLCETCVADYQPCRDGRC